MEASDAGINFLISFFQYGVMNILDVIAQQIIYCPKTELHLDLDFIYFYCFMLLYTVVIRCHKRILAEILLCTL